MTLEAESQVAAATVAAPKKRVSAPKKKAEASTAETVAAVVATPVVEVVATEAVATTKKASAKKAKAVSAAATKTVGKVKKSKKAADGAATDGAVAATTKSRGKSGYITFSTEHRKAVVAENPTATFPEIAKILGIKWSALSAEEKQKYSAPTAVVVAATA